MDGTFNPATEGFDLHPLVQGLFLARGGLPEQVYHARGTVSREGRQQI